MSLKVYNELDQGSDAWHAQRRGIVTASVVGRLISVGYRGAEAYGCDECGAYRGSPCISRSKRSEPTPIKTHHPARVAEAAGNRSPDAQVLSVSTGDDARGLTLLLAAERITGHTDPTWMSSDMWNGIEGEPLARDVYSEHYAPVSTAGFMVRDDWSFPIGYSPDGLVGDDGLVEVKTRRQKTQLSTILNDEIPAENMAQLQAGLLVSGRHWIDYISFCGGMRLWRKRVTPDPRWFEAIIAAVQRFEETAARMVNTYEEATVGMPDTQRLDLEMSI